MKSKRIIAVGLAMALAFLSSAATTFAAKPLPSGKVNINTASVEQLSTLPGVGEKLAARIIAYREKSGSFSTPQELMNVRGIGEKNFQRMQEYVTTTAPAKPPAGR